MQLIDPPVPVRRSRMQVLLTASDAVQALEAAFLDARWQINASFALFDPATPLQSARARAVGRNWADLVGNTLARGVTISLTISDFDSVLHPAAHRAAAQSVRLLEQVAAAMPAAKLVIRAMLHDGEAGTLAQLCDWPLTLWRLARSASWLNRQTPVQREASLADMPGLRARLVTGRRGKWRARVWGLPPLHRLIHHQKLAVFDKATLFIGSFDLDQRLFGVTQPQGLSLLLRGPVVAECVAHLDSYLDRVAGGHAAATAPQPVARLLLRTLSCRRITDTAWRGMTPLLQDIARMHLTLIRRTMSLIYIETARFSDPHLASRLLQAARGNPQLTMILILPEPGHDSPLRSRFADWQQVRALRQLAKTFGPRLFIGGYALSAPDTPAPDALWGGSPFYGHAKVSIFDAKAGIVSSASLDRAGLRLDTEAGVYLNHPSDLDELRRSVLARWLPQDAAEPFFALDTAAAQWAGLALANAKSQATQRRGLILPYGHRPS